MKKALTIALALTVSGCMTTRTHKYSPVSGSKADGRVTMVFFYEDNMFLNHEVDEESAHREALRRCQNWGYQDVESFVPMVQQSHLNEYDTPIMKVTRDFQCLD